MGTMALFVTSQRADFHMPKKEKIDFVISQMANLLMTLVGSSLQPPCCGDHTQDVADCHIHTVDRWNAWTTQSVQHVGVEGAQRRPGLALKSR